jgi:phenylpyruvate tautomerase PptA (4-oxalocrotonate tautomerase family)
MPLIQLDVQPLTDDQRADLRTQAVAAVSEALGSPSACVSVVIRESNPANLVEAGGWGAYHSREVMTAARPEDGRR